MSLPVGVGLGFRFELASAMFEASAGAGPAWVEIHPENYLGRGGLFARHLDRVLERWPVLTHGLTSCVGDPEPFDRAHLAQLRALLRRTGGRLHSEHLCFGSAGGLYAHDLLPLPFTDEAMANAVQRIRELQGALEVEIAIENTSYYAHPGGLPVRSELSFLLEVLERADAKLLLDVNNVFVNAVNHGFDAAAFLDAIPPERVAQIHVAGHLVRPDGLIVDTHAEPVRAEVLALVERTLARVGPGVPILLERDGNFPPLAQLLAELDALETLRSRAAAPRDPGGP
jgi:uncharacterized protein (UPF0276 family)